MNIHSTFIPLWDSPLSIAGFFAEGFGSRAANLLHQVDMPSQDFESRSGTRPTKKIIRKDF
jgi:hypothetical protein